MKKQYFAFRQKQGFSKKCLLYGKGFLFGFLKGGFLGLLFYKSGILLWFGGLIFGVIDIMLLPNRERKRLEKEITLQFKEGLQGISSALSAGYSIENAFSQAKAEIVLLYGEDAILVQEFQRIEKKLELNCPVEDALFDFAERWKTEDILHFAQVFQTAKRTGGNLIAITRSTAEKIGQKIEVKREIDTLISGKRMEGQIMNKIPLAMILYFWICSPGFLDCFYRGTGRIVSTALLIFYLAAYFWSEKICDIQV